MTLSITQRLLCASQHTYMIAVAGAAPTSKVPPAPPALVGYDADPPQCYVGALNAYNAGMIGVAPTEIVVAFRGTEPFNNPDPRQMILDFERLLGLSKLIVTGQFEQIMDDHTIARGSGCANLVCAGV